MKREIKFRAWAEGYKEFAPNHIVAALLENIQLGDNDDNYVIEQFTGLLDKNGKEIYHGDICHFGSGMIREIIWKDGGFVYERSYGYNSIGKYIAFSTHFDLPLVLSELEVIGNIHENANLLTPTNQ